MPIGCSIFSTDADVDMGNLESELKSYDSKTPHQKLDKELRTTVENVKRTNRGLLGTIYYDRPRKLGARPGEDPWVKETLHAEVRFVDEDPLGTGFISIGPKHKRTQTRSEVADILGVNAEQDIDLQGINADALTKVVADDSRDSTFGWWEDVDADTSSASITGDIESSTHAKRIDSKGKPTWVVFVSDRYDLKVGVSRDNVVFYGKGWTHDMMEDYVYDKVLPKI